MTAMRRTLLCAFALSLICSLFITIGNVRDSFVLMWAGLTQRYRASRRRRRPAGSRFMPFPFKRLATLAMIAVMSAQSALASPEVSHVMANTVSATAINSAQGAHFWWHSSGWAARYERLRNEYLPIIGAQSRPRGWDGKGAPRHSRPAPPEMETRQDKEQKIARIKIFPGDVEIKTAEQIIFNAVAFDYDDTISGLDAQWSALHEERNEPVTITRSGSLQFVNLII